MAVGSLLAVDVILLLTWTAVDPLLRQVHNFAQDAGDVDEEDDVVIQRQLEHCKSRHHPVWLGIMYAYKGLQLVLGLFLAYETRSVKLKQINDSRLVGMAIYNVAILCMITAPVILVIGNQQNAAFCFVSLANVFCCYLSMALVFIPKVIFIRQHAHDPREKEDDERETAEQELRYRELLKANEELQRKVADKEQRLAILKKRLVEKKEEEEALRRRNSSETAEEVSAVAQINSFNNNLDPKAEGLRNRKNGEAAGAGSGRNNSVSELDRRGITVLRSSLGEPGKRGMEGSPNEDHVESYL